MKKISKSENELLSDMRKSHRYLIRKSLKMHIEISKTNDAKAVDDFLLLYKDLSDRKHFVPHRGIREELMFFGQDNEALLTTKDKLKALKKLIIYSRSCDCASLLGPHCLNNGAKAFIGYKQPFIFIYNPSLSTHPLADSLAELFLNPSNIVATTLLKGHSPKEADKRSKKAFQKNIQKLLTSETPKEYSAAIRFLFWDMKHQVCLKKEE